MVDRGKSGTPGGGARVPDEYFNTEACWSDGSGDLLVLNTGDWRTARPVFDNETCNACGFCYVFCPTQCIVDAEHGIHYTAVLDYCKGCGICAKECPKGAIAMVAEADYAEECEVEK